MHPLWLQQAIDFLSGNAETSFSGMALRALLIACSLFASVQLLTMLATRWGERHAMAKSFGLSVLVHLSFGLGWVELAEQFPPQPLPPPVQPPITFQLLTAPPSSDELPTVASTDELPVWERSSNLAAGPQKERRDRASTATDVELPQVTRQENQSLEPQFRAMDALPSPADAGEQPVEAVRPAKAPRVATRTAATATALEDETAVEVRRESLPSNRSRQASRRPQEGSFLPVPVPLPQSPSAPKPEREAMAEMTTPAANLETAAANPRPPTPANLSPQQIGFAPPKGVTNAAGVTDAKTEVTSAPTELPLDGSNRVVRGILRGIVRDAVNGRPLALAVVRYDQLDRRPLTAVSKDDGTYQLALSETPDNFAITVTRPGYLPESRNLRGVEVDGRTRRMDFEMRPLNDSVIAIEENPKVHHLGNDQFEGKINSQFQSPSEGTTLEATFLVTADQLQARPARAAVTMLVKGLQCPAEVRINGTLLPQPADGSPADGSFGPMMLLFHPTHLRLGENTISIKTVSCNGDLDDFEFVNVQIRLSRSTQIRPPSIDKPTGP